MICSLGTVWVVITLAQTSNIFNINMASDGHTHLVVLQVKVVMEAVALMITVRQKGECP